VGRPRDLLAAAVVSLIGCLLVIWLTAPQPPAAARPVGSRPAASAGHAPVRALMVRTRPPVVTGRLTIPRALTDHFVRVPILMYHRVTDQHAPSQAAEEFTVTPAQFAAEMDWLQQNGYTPVREAALLGALIGGAPLPAHPVLITVDDGYVDGVHAILHTLVTKTRRFPATFFVITRRIGRADFLTWRDLGILERNGMDIGSHTVHHTHLTQVGPARVRFEVTESATTLRRGLHHPIYWFSYPFGNVDPAITAAVEKAGYLLAFTTQPGTWLSTTQRLTLPRVIVTGNEPISQFASSVQYG
jgi:peptidoglycan/xylan/chitin deacetylase (PgdA/CDA1 family)